MTQQQSPCTVRGHWDPWTWVATRQPRGLVRIQILSDLARIFQFSFTPFSSHRIPMETQTMLLLFVFGWGFYPSLGEGAVDESGK